MEPPSIKILGTGPAAVSAPQTRQQTGTQAWQVGQILDAIVVSTTGKNTLTLRIHNTLLEAAHQTPLPFTPNQPLQLKVIQPGKQPVLQILAAKGNDDVITEALRNALPRQIPLASALKTFTNIMHTDHESFSAPELVRLVKHLLDRLPSLQSAATPEGLKQAIKNSGVFLEHKLSAALPETPAADELAQDVKAALLELKSELATVRHAEKDTDRAHAGPAQRRAPVPSAAVNAPEENFPLEKLDRTVDAALARVQLHQLSSLNTTDTSAALMTLELPLRHGEQVDVCQISIRRESAAPGKKQANRWSITLQFDLEPSGPMYARIDLTEQQISATLWAEKPELVMLINTHIEDLRHRLAKTGLGIGNLHCHQGRPPEEIPPRLSVNLLDTHA